MTIQRCDICDYSTTTKGNLSIHMQSDKHINNLKELKENNNSSKSGSGTETTTPTTTSTSQAAVTTTSGCTSKQVMDEHLNNIAETENQLRLVKNKLPHLATSANPMKLNKG